MYVSPRLDRSSLGQLYRLGLRYLVSVFTRLTCTRILVTGPQRSGTTIATQMIAEDLGLRYVDEMTFAADNLILFREVLRVSRDVVVQCPAMLAQIIRRPPCGWLTVLMRRPLRDVHRSEDRLRAMRPDWRPTVVAEVAYGLWDAHPPPCSVVLPYASLACHPLWVPAPDRVGFTPKQTRRVLPLDTVTPQDVASGHAGSAGGK